MDSREVNILTDRMIPVPRECRFSDGKEYLLEDKCPITLQVEETDQVPFDTYAHIEPVYTEFKGWNADLTGCRHENELPEEFRNYIAFMEKYLGVPIRIISLGPDRDATIMR